MTLGRWRCRLTGLLAAGALVGCAAGARLEGGVYVVREKGYRVVAPEGWERIASEADLALRQPAGGGGLMAHATCEGKTPGRPLPVLVRHLRFGLRDVKGLDEAPVELSGQRGVRSRFVARLDDVPVSVSAVTLQGGRCVYDLVVVAPEGRLPAVADDFARFTESFRVMESTP